MAFRVNVDERGIAELAIDNPPVNALGRDAWFALARKIEELGRDANVRVLVIRAEGRGFQCGVDVKELAKDGSIIVAVNRGCYDTFAAIYDCPLPVISAVHGYCLGGGIGIAGSSDLVLASDDATFGLPEIDRGAMGAATHAMRMFGMQEARRMLLTGEPIGAAEAHRLGGLLAVVPRARLRDEALAQGRGDRLPFGRNPALLSHPFPDKKKTCRRQTERRGWPRVARNNTTRTSGGAPVEYGARGGWR